MHGDWKNRPIKIRFNGIFDKNHQVSQNFISKMYHSSPASVFTTNLAIFDENRQFSQTFTYENLEWVSDIFG